MLCHDRPLIAFKNGYDVMYFGQLTLLHRALRLEMWVVSGFTWGPHSISVI